MFVNALRPVEVKNTRLTVGRAETMSTNIKKTKASVMKCSVFSSTNTGSQFWFLNQASES